MLCEFIGGPENGQREEIADDCREAYCTGLSRDSVDWYERDASDLAKFIHRGQIARAVYLERTKEARRIREIEKGFQPGPLPDWIKPGDLPEWAR
jgi:hypothetical protein